MSDPKTLVIREDCNGRKYPIYVDSSTEEARIAILEQQLSAEREARKKAEATLAKYGTTSENIEWTLAELKQRAESAEQKLREAQEQEPMFWVRLRSDGGYEAPIHNSNIEKVRKESGAWTPLYAAPIPPADVAELQRLVADLRANAQSNEEASFNQVARLVDERDMLQRENAELQTRIAALMALNAEMSEAKRQAVPEDIAKDAQRWHWLTSDCDGNEQDDFMRWLRGVVVSKKEIDDEIDKAMIAAAPQPNGVDK